MWGHHPYEAATLAETAVTRDGVSRVTAPESESGHEHDAAAEEWNPGRPDPFLELQIHDPDFIAIGVERGGDPLNDCALVFTDGLGQARQGREAAKRSSQSGSGAVSRVSSMAANCRIRSRVWFEFEVARPRQG